MFDLNVFCFAIELLCAQLIFLYRFHRKKYFFYKLVGFLLVILLYSLFFPKFNIANTYLRSLYSFFNSVVEKSFGSVNFKHYLYPLSLIGVFVFVSAAVLRVFIDNSLAAEQQKENEEKQS